MGRAAAAEGGVMPVGIDGYERYELGPQALGLPLSDKQLRLLWVFVCMGGRIPRACADEMEKIHRAQYERRTVRSKGRGLPGFSLLFNGNTMNALADRGLLQPFGNLALERDTSGRGYYLRPGYADRIGWEITSAGEAAVRDVQRCWRRIRVA